MRQSKSINSKERGTSGTNKLSGVRYYLSQDVYKRAMRRKVKKHMARFAQENRDDIPTPLERFIVERKHWPKRNSKSARWLKRTIDHQIKTKGVDFFS
jgi:hypothetical protein